MRKPPFYQIANRTNTSIPIFPPYIPRNNTNNTVNETVLGCVEYANQGNCSQCSPQSILDFDNNICFCNFNYEIKIALSPIPVNNTFTYDLTITTNETFDTSIYGILTPCSDLLFFIFENQTILDNYSLLTDLLICEFRNTSNITNCSASCGASQIIISSMQKSLLDVFLAQLIVISLDLNFLDIQCSGFIEYLISSEGLQCEAEGQQEFCDIREEALVPGGLESGGGCQIGQSLSVMEESRASQMNITVDSVWTNETGMGCDQMLISNTLEIGWWVCNTSSIQGSQNITEIIVTNATRGQVMNLTNGKAELALILSNFQSDCGIQTLVLNFTQAKIIKAPGFDQDFLLS
ncbi:hypothetical protein FGO68_gene7982 [Halteria grandinella]|uniref:Uncharacterized protein n=1 Tax=Halteria grandinella TaxID=5974 RepID=A0A8J8NN73_HALGN|nr:hypothetical protein FGO68_gene7982 [Halteria grandinella]